MTEPITKNKHRTEMEKGSLGTKQYILEIAGNEKNILSFMNQKRKEGGLDHCEVILVASGRKYSAHKIVLEWYSDFFRQRLNRNKGDVAGSSRRRVGSSKSQRTCLDASMTHADASDQAKPGDVSTNARGITTIALPGITPKELEPVLEFMYTSRIVVGAENVNEILLIGCLLQISTIIELCADVILRHPRWRSSLVTEEIAKYASKCTDATTSLQSDSSIDVKWSKGKRTCVCGGEELDEVSALRHDPQQAKIKRCQTREDTSKKGAINVQSEIVAAGQITAKTAYQREMICDAKTVKDHSITIRHKKSQHMDDFSSKSFNSVDKGHYGSRRRNDCVHLAPHKKTLGKSSESEHSYRTYREKLERGGDRRFQAWIRHDQTDDETIRSTRNRLENTTENVLSPYLTQSISESTITEQCYKRNNSFIPGTNSFISSSVVKSKQNKAISRSALGMNCSESVKHRNDQRFSAMFSTGNTRTRSPEANLPKQDQFNTAGSTLTYVPEGNVICISPTENPSMRIAHQSVRDRYATGAEYAHMFGIPVQSVAPTYHSVISNYNSVVGSHARQMLNTTSRNVRHQDKTGVDFFDTNRTETYCSQVFDLFRDSQNTGSNWDRKERELVGASITSPKTYGLPAISVTPTNIPRSAPVSSPITKTTVDMEITATRHREVVINDERSQIHCDATVAEHGTIAEGHRKCHELNTHIKKTINNLTRPHNSQCATASREKQIEAHAYNDHHWRKRKLLSAAEYDSACNPTPKRAKIDDALRRHSDDTEAGNTFFVKNAQYSSEDDVIARDCLLTEFSEPDSDDSGRPSSA